MAPDACLEASVAMAKGADRLGRWRTGLERKRYLRESKEDWHEGVKTRTTPRNSGVTESKKRAGVAPSSAAVLDGRRRLYSPKKRAGVAPSYSTLDRSKN